MIISLSKKQIFNKEKETKYYFIVAIDGYRIHDGSHTCEIEALKEAFKKYDKKFLDL